MTIVKELVRIFQIPSRNNFLTLVPGILPSDCTIITSSEPLPPRGIVCGSPERVAVITTQYLQNVSLHTDFRGYKVFIGYIQDDPRPIFVANHEIGAPGATMIFEELIAHGVDTILRLGSSDLYLEGSKDPNKPAISLVRSEFGPRGLMRDYGFPSSEFDNIFETPATIYSSLVKAGGLFEKNLTVVESAGYPVDAFFSFNFPSRATYDPEITGDVISLYESLIEKKYPSTKLDRDMECGALYLVGWMRNVDVGCVLQVITKGGNKHANPGTQGIPVVLTALTLM